MWGLVPANGEVSGIARSDYGPGMEGDYMEFSTGGLWCLGVTEVDEFGGVLTALVRFYGLQSPSFFSDGVPLPGLRGIMGTVEVEGHTSRRPWGGWLATAVGEFYRFGSLGAGRWDEGAANEGVGGSGRLGGVSLELHYGTLVAMVCLCGCTGLGGGRAVL